MKSLRESLFDRDIATNMKSSSLLDLVKGHVDEVRLPYGFHLSNTFREEEISKMIKDYGEHVLPTKRYASKYYKIAFGAVNPFLNYLLSKVIVTNLKNIQAESRWVEDPLLEDVLNKISKHKMCVKRLVWNDNISFAFYWKDDNFRLKSSVVNIYFDKGVDELLNKVNESLFDRDLATSEITTLYDLFGSHIKKFQHTYAGTLGWTHFFDQHAVVREWKKEGCPRLSGGFAKTTFPPDLQKFVAVILKNSIVSKKQLLEGPEDGNLDDTVLNDKLTEFGIVLPEGRKWGATTSMKLVRLQIGYIEGIPATAEHGIQFRQVGTKRFKGLNTENIEISIYCYDPKRPGYGSHIWTILTDLTIKDLLLGELLNR